jgi:peptide/nickel transport system substrate-binding protein
MEENTMQRRDVFKLAVGASMLARPHIARAQRDRTLRFVPLINLVVLDPVTNANRAAHNHGYMVFDTLYGLDETFTARPQMVDGHIVERDGTLWTLRLRAGLLFHDGTPVLARDAVASIRRFAARDAFGQALMAVTTELSAPDDRTVRFRLAKPFRHLPLALAGYSVIMPCIMPERLAMTDPYRVVPEMVGSGPYRFIPAEFNAGERATYERFADYAPRVDGTASYTSGPKVAHFDRVEWRSIGDAATAVAALSQGEVDWLESPSADLVPLLARNDNVSVQVKEVSGSIPIMRFNQLYPPFDNSAIRQALLGAVNQADVMIAVAGTDHTYWRDGIGLFGPSSPAVNQVGAEVLGGPRDYAKVQRDLAAAGYRGERIVVLMSEIGFLPPICHVGADQLRKAGMNVDLQTMDLPTLLRRRANNAPPDKGGWNVFFGIQDCLFTDNPATNWAIRGNGKSATEGWPDSPRLEALRDAWLDAPDGATERRIAEQMQRQLWEDVPYIPMGHWVRSTASRRNIVDIPWGFPAFYGVRRV